MSKEGYSKDVTLSIEIKDTQAPDIVLKEETVTLAYGSDYDIKENIESVNDPVDGEVPYVEEAGENNYYIVEGSVDTSVPGDYTITITAVDKNGVEATKEYTVHVNEDVQEVPQEQPVSGNNGYKPPTSHGGNQNPPTNQGGGGNTPTPPSNTCVANGQWKSVGNSGVAFYSWEEADAWGDANCDYDNYFYSVITVHDICGKEGWSISFTRY